MDALFNDMITQREIISKIQKGRLWGHDGKSIHNAASCLLISIWQFDNSTNL